MLRILTAILTLWTVTAKAEDCSQYMTAKYNAARAGNLQLLYQYDAEYNRCLNTQQAVAPVAPPSPPPVYQPAPQLTLHDNAVIGAFQSLENYLLGAGRKQLDWTQPLSAAVQNQPTVAVTPQAQQAINQMLRPPSQPPAPPLPPGANPFTGQPNLSNQSTLQPPPGYVDPFAGKPLPPPGQLGVNNNCTFNSYSCQ